MKLTFDIRRHTIGIIVTIILLVTVGEICGSKILVVAPFFATSHTKVIRAVTSNLVERGHELTVITSSPIQDAPSNYRQILVDFSEYIEKMSNQSIWRHREFSIIKRILHMWNETFNVNEMVLSSKHLIDFIQKDKSHFDVVIVEMFYEEIFYPFAYKYKAPLILLETTTLRRSTEDIMGNPFHASYVPFDYLHQAGDLSFTERLNNWFLQTVDFLGRKYYYIPTCNEMARKHFVGDIPDIEDLEKNVSLILANTHYSIDTVMPLVPGIIQIGGVHIDPSKQLPQNIKKFLDDAKDGVVVFTMGSHAEISTMDEFKINALIKVFKSLKQRVIMKWETNNPPVAPNILTLKFLPQNDIMAHPNVVAFITHGGMLGVQEAISYGVPIIGIPLFADQYINIGKLVHLGAAIELDLLKINEETARYALERIIDVPSYRENAKELSRRFKERPMGPVDTAMYWIEYVIKFKGTPFLKSPIATMPWYKYRMLDVIAFVTTILICVLIVFLYLCKFVCGKIIGRSHSTVKSQRKKNL